MGIMYYHVWLITRWITGGIAAAAPVAAIAALSKTNTIDVPFEIVAGLNALLCMCLLVFTEASRSDMFLIAAV